MVQITRSLKIIRLIYSETIEREISDEKEKRKLKFLEKNKNKLDKKDLEEGAKKSEKLDQKFWQNLKEKHPEIITMSEFYLLMRKIQFKLTKVYNESISELYISKVIKKEKGSTSKFLSNVAYKKAYAEVKDSSLASGLREKIKSNFDKSKLNDLFANRISLPTKKADTFSIPMYKQSSGDKYSGFKVIPYKKEFVIKLSLPEYKIKEVESKGKKYNEVEFLESKKKKELLLLLSTKRRIRNKTWIKDDGTDADIRKLISFDENEKSEFQKEWEEYVEFIENDERLKAKWMEQHKKQSRGEKTWVDTREWLVNKYKIGWIEILKGKKINEKQWWFVNFVIEKPPRINNFDSEEKIFGGIDLGWSNPIIAALNSSLKRLSISSNEVVSFNKKALSRRREILRNSRWKRGGHGKKTKFEVIDKLTKSNENRRTKIMERWVKTLTDFFLNNKVNMVQMENLSNLKKKKEDTDFFKLQRMYWPYAKLQEMIKNKFKEYGIELRLINPRFTSQLCSNPKCRHWNSYFTFNYRNENKSPLFKCERCELEIPADYNAAKNITTPEIEGIISKITEKDKCNCENCKNKNIK